MKEKTIENVIVDLYEMRASLIVPLHQRKMERVHDMFKHNFINVMIAQICDKYKIQHEDIEEAIRKRAHQEEMESITPITNLS